MRAPEEVFQSAQHGQPRTAEELTREQRRAARAKRKRGGKKEKEGQVGGSCGGMSVAHMFCSALGLEPEGVADKETKYSRRDKKMRCALGNVAPPAP